MAYSIRPPPKRIFSTIAYFVAPLHSTGSLLVCMQIYTDSTIHAALFRARDLTTLNVLGPTQRYNIDTVSDLEPETFYVGSITLNTNV